MWLHVCERQRGHGKWLGSVGAPVITFSCSPAQFTAGIEGVAPSINTVHESIIAVKGSGK